MVFYLYSLVYPQVKNILLALLLFFTNLLFAQEFSILNDKYSGVLSGIQNPANIVNTPYKLDINLFSNFSSLGNNMGGIKYLDLIKDSKLSLKDISFKYSRNSLDSLRTKADFKTLENYLHNLNLNNHSYAFAESRILGPSFLLSLTTQDAIAFYSTVRVNSFLFNLNSNILFDSTIESLEELSQFHGSNIRGYGQFTTWAELGFSYSKVVYQTHDKLIKLGGSIKFLKGIKHYSVELNDFETQLNLFIPDPLKSTLSVDGSINLENSSSGFNFGQGLDIGIVFEKNKEHYHSFHATKYNKIYFNTVDYTYKIGLSITDLGFINFDNVRKEIKNVNTNLPNSTSNYRDFLLVGNEAIKEKSKYILPTTLHVNFDYNFYKNLFLSSNLDVFLFPYSEVKYIKSISNLTIGARFEKLKFSFANNFNIDALNNLKYLFHIRTGYFYAGGSILLKNYEFAYHHDSFFLGLKIPLYH